jgi:hypothetical protein
MRPRDSPPPGRSHVIDDDYSCRSTTSIFAGRSCPDGTCECPPAVAGAWKCSPHDAPDDRFGFTRSRPRPLAPSSRPLIRSASHRTTNVYLAVAPK